MSFFTTNTTGNYDKLAYDFNFNDLDGNPLSLSEYKNKIIVAINNPFFGNSFSAIFKIGYAVINMQIICAMNTQIGWAKIK